MLVDVSEDLDVVVEKLNVSLGELVNIGVESSVVLVFNKCDLISQDVLDYRIKFFKDMNILNDKKMVFISVKNDFNINNLSDAIYSSLPSLVCCKIKIPLNDKSQSFVSWIYETAHVLDISYDDFVIVSFECTSSVCDKIVSRCKDLDGLVLS